MDSTERTESPARGVGAPYLATSVSVPRGANALTVAGGVYVADTDLTDAEVAGLTARQAIRPAREADVAAYDRRAHELRMAAEEREGAERLQAAETARSERHKVVNQNRHPRAVRPVR